MLHVCMSKEDSVLREIELLLEEKFSKIGMYYEVAELQLNDGSKKNVYFNLFTTGIDVNFELVIDRIAPISIEKFYPSQQRKTIKSKIENIKNMIKYSDNIVSLLDAALNVASARFKVYGGAIGVNKTKITIVILSKTNIRISLEENFTKDADVFRFKTNSQIKNKNFNSFILTSDEIKAIKTLNDLFKACSSKEKSMSNVSAYKWPNILPIININYTNRYRLDMIKKVLYS
jgi:hypothetical protein